MFIRKARALGAAAVVAASAGAIVIAGLSVASAAAPPEVVAYGHQVTGNGIDPAHDAFGLAVAGSGTSAKGSFSVWDYTENCAGGNPCNFAFTRSTVTCLQVVSPTHVVVTGVGKYKGAKRTVVADVIDGADPSTTASPDQVRFTTYLDGGAGGCQTPSSLGPISILSGDIQIQHV
jgi:hypothetical protein